MRFKTLTIGAALAALLMCSIPAQAGCLSGLFGGRRAARQQAAMMAAGGDCYSSSYSSFQSYGGACATGNCGPQMATIMPQQTGFTAVSCSTCPSGYAYVPNTQLAGYYSSLAYSAPVQQRYVQYAPVATAQTATAATGCGCCDRCRCAVTPAPPSTSPTAPPPPTPPPTLGDRTAAPARNVRSVSMPNIKPPDPIAPPIAYMPPAKVEIETDVLVAFR